MIPNRCCRRFSVGLVDPFSCCLYIAVLLANTANGVGLGLGLDGINDYAKASTTVFPTSSSLHSFTVEAWIFPTTTGIRMIATDDTYDLRINYSAGRILEFLLYEPLQGGGLSIRTAQATGVVGYYEWNHVAGGYDASTGNQIVALNGVVNTSAYNGASFVSDPNFSFHVGQSGGNGAYFRGNVDEVRVSDIARYSTNFNPSNVFAPDANTIGLYHFDEGLGSTSFADSSGNGIALTAYNGATIVEIDRPMGIPGDYNGDTIVDAADYVVWRNSGETQTGYTTWRSNFGKTVGGAAIPGKLMPPAVPEPASVILISLGLAACGHVRRRRTNAHVSGQSSILRNLTQLISPRSLYPTARTSYLFVHALMTSCRELDRR